VAAGSAPLWGPRALGQLSFFRVRRVEIEGARYASPAELVARLGTDTAASVWRDLAPMAARVRTHPLVADARVERRLPGVLVLYVREKAPVAATAAGSGVTFYDTAGTALPITAAAIPNIDVPLVAAPDRALLRALGALQVAAPALYARVSEARRVRGARPELAFALAVAPDTVTERTPPGSAARPLLVRAALDVTPPRFADALLVERDLARRGVRPLELDLRFRDQVVARLP
jgi:cell division protein FtsQ